MKIQNLKLCLITVLISLILAGCEREKVLQEAKVILKSAQEEASKIIDLAVIEAQHIKDKAIEEAIEEAIDRAKKAEYEYLVKNGRDEKI